MSDWANPSPPPSPSCLSLSRLARSALKPQHSRERHSNSFFKLGSLRNYGPTPPPSKRSSRVTSKRTSWDFGIFHRFRKSTSDARAPLPSAVYSTWPSPTVPAQGPHDKKVGTRPWQRYPGDLHFFHASDLSLATMNRASLLHPEARMSLVGKAKQMKAAEEMQRSVAEKSAKRGVNVPPYDFLELIGKGSFGRVFKSKSHEDGGIVAIKIIDVDKTDYKLGVAEKDQAMKDLTNEISILTTLKESKAKNINLIYQAFAWHSQLWIVSEYCPGGSVHTLMRASPKEKEGLEEKFIIPIARELAVAMKYVHEAGIIHRDIKCGNVLITQDGQVQLCDFGVSGVLEGAASKRSTIIGTPYWMAPELHEAGPDTQGYGQEIDCWAYGCTVYEMATGLPPNSKVMPARLYKFLEQAPRLEGDEYSFGLRDFVKFLLVANAADRPDASAVQKHEYIAGSAKKYPTQGVRELIARYTVWEQRGGNRVSLWQPGGAASTTLLKPFEEPRDNDEWNFSTTYDFADDVLSHFASDPNDAPKEPERQLGSRSSSATRHQREQESRAQRGAAKMRGLFDEDAEPYKYSSELDDDQDSDLAFRRNSDMFGDHEETIIDLDAARMSADLSSVTSLADVQTIRAKKSANKFFDFYADDDEDDAEAAPTWDGQGDKRATMDWSFPAKAQNTMPARSIEKRPPTLAWSLEDAQKEANGSENVDAGSGSAHAAPQRPQLLHTTTMPIGQVGDFRHPRADDYDLSFEPPDRDSYVEYEPDYLTLSRQPSTAGTESAMTDVTDGNPFGLEETYNDRTIRGKALTSNRLSTHAYSQSEPYAGERTSTGIPVSMHDRGTSLTTGIEHDRIVAPDSESVFHNRNISVKDSMDSLREASKADEIWEEQCLPVLKTIPRDDPLLSMGENTLTNGNWGQYQRWRPTNGHSVDSDAASTMASDTEDYHRTQRRPVFHGDPVTPPLSRAHSRRYRRRFESDADGDFDVNGYRQPPLRQYRSQTRRVIEFPEARPPIPSALADDAPQDLLHEELHRLLSTMEGSLVKSSQLLKSEQQASQPRQRYSNHGAAAGSGSGSGSGQDFGRRNGYR